MDKKLLGELEANLEAQKISLQKELETFAQKDEKTKHNWEAKYPNREDGDKEEEADEVQQYENALSLEYSLETKLKDVNIALDKIKNGKYGICDNCGKEIDEQRLRACPEARTCLKCSVK